MAETSGASSSPDPDAAERARRAATFTQTGADYHRLRPRYADPAVDFMLPGSPRRVLDLGAGAVVTGRLALRFQRGDAPPQQASSWVTAVWLREGEGWRLAVFQSTREAAPA